MDKITPEHRAQGPGDIGDTHEHTVHDEREVVEEFIEPQNMN